MFEKFDGLAERKKVLCAYARTHFQNMNFRLAVFFLFVFGALFKSSEAGNKLDLEGLKDMLKPMSKSCKSKTGVTDAMVAGTKDGLFPRERPLMCFFKCLSVMLKAMNKKGEFTLRDLNKQIDLLMMEELGPRMKAVVKKCVDRVPPSDDPCELAYDMVVCGYKEDPSLYFLPS